MPAGRSESGLEAGSGTSCRRVFRPGWVTDGGAVAGAWVTGVVGPGGAVVGAGAVVVGLRGAAVDGGVGVVVVVVGDSPATGW